MVLVGEWYASVEEAPNMKNFLSEITPLWKQQTQVKFGVSKGREIVLRLQASSRSFPSLSGESVCAFVYLTAESLKDTTGRKICILLNLIHSRPRR